MAAVGGGTSGGQGAGGVRAGAAFVELLAKDKIGPVLDKLQKRFATIGSTLTKGGAAGLGAGAAILAPIVALAAAGADRFDKMANEAKRLDLPIDQFYRLATAAEIAGVSVEQLADDPRKYADSLALVGEAPVEAIKAAAEASREWRATLIALKDAAAGLLVDLRPIIQAAGAFARNNAGAVKVAAAVGAGLAALGVGAIVTGAAFNVLSTSVVALKVALLLLLSPVGLIVAAVTGLTAVFLTQTEAGRQMAAELKGLFQEIGQTFGETWGGIVAAVAKGDLKAAVDVACAGVKVAWLQMVEFLKREWYGFKNWFADSAKTFVPFSGAALALRLGIVPGFGRNHVEEGAESLRRTERELRQARADLNRAVAAAQAPWTGPGARALSPGDAITPAMMARARGTFGGPLGQQLGAGNQFQRDLLRGVNRDADASEAAKKVLDGIAGQLARVLQFQ